MHALNNTSMVTGDVKYVKWALELAKTAHAHFTYIPDQWYQKKNVLENEYRFKTSINSIDGAT